MENSKYGKYGFLLNIYDLPKHFSCNATFDKFNRPISASLSDVLHVVCSSRNYNYDCNYLWNWSSNMLCYVMLCYVM